MAAGGDNEWWLKQGWEDSDGDSGRSSEREEARVVVSSQGCRMKGGEWLSDNNNERSTAMTMAIGVANDS